MTFRFFKATAAAATAVLGIVLVTSAAGDQRKPDVSHGSSIATQGTQTGVPACSQCHAAGNPRDATEPFPRLSGQSAFYLSKQLRSFSSGQRSDAIMSPIAKTLSDEEITDVAAYFAGLDEVYPDQEKADIKLLKRGEELATTGDFKKNVQACNNCHGPGGLGEPPTIPYLAGQYASYTALQLHLWQKGIRKTSLNEMAIIAQKLDESDIQAISVYFENIKSKQADWK